MVASASSSDLMSARHTFAPSAQNAFAMARPIPFAAPVTSAVYPLSETIRFSFRSTHKALSIPAFSDDDMTSRRAAAEQFI